jgi:exonuclease-1
MGKETDSYIRYCLARIETLVSHGVRKIIMVFDGGPLPSKEGTEMERAASRARNNELARRLMREGNVEAARGAFAKSVDVSPQMAARVIGAMKARWGESGEQVDWLVAPYEADAQLGYLAREGIADVIISEDSDNLPYGVKRVCFKWDGQCGEQVLLSDVLAMRGGSAGSLDLTGWTHDMLLYMCVLSGCDYLPSVPGVGVKAAHKLVARHREPKQLLRALRFAYDVKVPLDYEVGFFRALRTFKHQKVFDPRTGTVVPLTPEPLIAEASSESDGNSDDARSFLGDVIPPDTAVGIARGVLDPVRPYEPFKAYSPVASAGAAEFVKAPAAPRNRPLSAPVCERSQPGINAFFGRKVQERGPSPPQVHEVRGSSSSFPRAKRRIDAHDDNAAVPSLSSDSQTLTEDREGESLQGQSLENSNIEVASTEDPVLLHPDTDGASTATATGVATSRHFGIVSSSSDQSPPTLKKRVLGGTGSSKKSARRGFTPSNHTSSSSLLVQQPAPRRPRSFKGLKKFVPPTSTSLTGKENESPPSLASSSLGRFAFNNHAPKAMLKSTFLSSSPDDNDEREKPETLPTAATATYLESFAFRGAAPSPAPSPALSSNGYGYDSLSPPVSTERPHLDHSYANSSQLHHHNDETTSRNTNDATSCPACRGRKRAHTCGRGKKAVGPPLVHAPAPSALLFEDFAFGAS